MKAFVGPVASHGALSDDLESCSSRNSFWTRVPFPDGPFSKSGCGGAYQQLSVGHDFICKMDVNVIKVAVSLLVQVGISRPCLSKRGGQAVWFEMLSFRASRDQAAYFLNHCR